MEKVIYEIEINEIGSFLERPNRFISKVELKNRDIVTVHVHDSGRIKELLYEGNEVSLRKAKDLTKRKTEWDLISAKAPDGEDILLNSSFHRYISENILRDFSISPFGEVDLVKAEVKNGHSRLDYCLEKNGEKIWVEVKGVSLSENKIAIFPDAPSERAVKHLETLMEIKEKGERAAVMLLIFRDSHSFIPNYKTDKSFFETFYKAISKGVEVYPIQLKLKNGKISFIDKKINIISKENTIF
ncbi:MAG: DNA/RNA nuclease SfsA [Fusobacterium perfoetens]|uniref:DNA/RNA nuclease SfsA n=1 Tax=Fusobacterium perfoetens TaxID=852 RepID=UPI0023F56395|nr:DNA/RNA nuclease SfsA [Fusobacterium perfoetens]MCI6152590.1 DNA/RNA nuclease SfsA [Fusobacterium perfoetens]MDY3237597.1 DNA/RNA nuclease SfsA [Fusobacterium perfoetens]